MMHSLLYDQGSLAKVTVMQFQVLQVFEPPSSLAKKRSEITIGQLIITILRFTYYLATSQMFGNHRVFETPPKGTRSIYCISLHSFLPCWIVSVAKIQFIMLKYEISRQLFELATISRSKKNGFRGNYMRKYSS